MYGVGLRVLLDNREFSREEGPGRGDGRQAEVGCRV